MPLAGADFVFYRFAGFEGEEGGIADEDGGVCLLQHGDGVGCGGEEGGVGVVEFAEQDFGVGEGAAGGGVGGDGADGAEGVRRFRVGRFNDELDGADFVERGDGTAGDDGEIGREGGDGDEAEICAGGEEFVGAERRLSVVESVALGERGGEWRGVPGPPAGGGGWVEGGGARAGGEW